MRVPSGFASSIALTDCFWFAHKRFQLRLSECTECYYMFKIQFGCNRFPLTGGKTKRLLQEVEEAEEKGLSYSPLATLGQERVTPLLALTVIPVFCRGARPHHPIKAVLGSLAFRGAHWGRLRLIAGVCAGCNTFPCAWALPRDFKLVFPFSSPPPFGKEKEGIKQ